MSRPPKIFFPGSVHFVSISVEEDFMFPPNALVKELIEKSIAQAQQLYPIKIIAILVESTHVHMLIRVIDPQDAVDFFERFKTESAHAVNRLLGRKKRTVWCEGYDSPLVDDVETIKDKLAYIYENPAKDGLTDQVDHFPGVCTWNDFKSLGPRSTSKRVYETRYLPRSDFNELPDGHLVERDYERLRRKLIHGKKKNFYEVDFNAWMERFGITDPQEQHEVNKNIIAMVREREAVHRALREKESRGVIGRKRLVETTVGGRYRPERTGRRMLVHSVDPNFRKEQIRWIKALIQAGRDVLARWRLGDTSVQYPMGLFPPTGVRLVEPIGW